MLRTIQFNNQFCLWTIKIGNVSSHNFLPQKSHRILPKKIIPEMPFFFRHLFAQLFSKGDQVFVVLGLHSGSSQKAPLCKGGWLRGSADWGIVPLAGQAGLYRKVSIPQSASLTAPFTQGGLWRLPTFNSNPLPSAAFLGGGGRRVRRRSDGRRGGGRRASGLPRRP